MGKKTLELSFDEMQSIVHGHLIDTCDNVSDKSKMSIRRAGQYSRDFILTIEDEEVNDNQEEWKAGEKANLRRANIRMLKLLGWTLVAVGSMIFAMPYIMPYLTAPVS